MRELLLGAAVEVLQRGVVFNHARKNFEIVMRPAKDRWRCGTHTPKRLRVGDVPLRGCPLVAVSGAACTAWCSAAVGQ